jgi:hypothetical protein
MSQRGTKKKKRKEKEKTHTRPQPSPLGYPELLGIDF